MIKKIIYAISSEASRNRLSVIRGKSKKTSGLFSNKRGISIMIGYILLISGAIIMSAIVYQWMKTYVPKDSIDCPDGVSLMVTESICSENLRLDLTIKNNGRFNIDGYFIYGKNNLSQELAAIDLSSKILTGGENLSGAIIFTAEGDSDPSLKPGAKKRSVFSLTEEMYGIEIMPLRFQTIDNKKRLVSCSNAKITENIVCATPEPIPEPCTLDTDCTGTEVCVSGVCTLCGNGVWVVDVEDCDCGTTDCKRNELGEVNYDLWNGCSSSCLKEIGVLACSEEPSVC